MKADVNLQFKTSEVWYLAVTNDQGTLISQQRYLPFGGVCTNIGSIAQTDYGYTGQRNLDEGIGLMDYKARFYSPVLNRFIQPDSIVPNPMNLQMFNRFSYVGNKPINFNDPTGHLLCDADGYCDQQSSINQRNSSGRCIGKCASPKPPKPEKEDLPHCSSRACDPNILNALEEIESCPNYPLLPMCKALFPSNEPEVTIGPFPPEGYYIAGYEEYTDWNKVDKVELTVDIAGLLADAGYLTWETPIAPVTVPLTIIAQGIEWVGIGMAVLDVIERNDFKDISMYGLQKNVEQIFKAAKVPRAIPLVGIGFTLRSIAQNVGPARDKRPILLPIP